jgi:hypothetical protein
MREDWELRQYAKDSGFTEKLHTDDIRSQRFEKPLFSITFIKGDTHIWFCRLGWQVADLTGDGVAESVGYRNHRPQPTLKEALDSVK